MNENNDIVRMLKAALRNGFTFSVFDGDAWPVRKSQDLDAAIEAVEAVEEAEVIFLDSDNRQVGWALCIPSLEDDEAVVDYSQDFDNPWISDAIDARPDREVPDQYKPWTVVIEWPYDDGTDPVIVMHVRAETPEMAITKAITDARSFHVIDCETPVEPLLCFPGHQHSMI